MDIRFYNTLTKQVEPFEPLNPNVVRMYHCGPTVYDYVHIGNFRSFLLGDLLRRFFEFVGYDVVQVMNITDVGHMTQDQYADGAGQDKMELAAERLKQAKKQGKADVEDPGDPYQIAKFFTNAFLEDGRLMGLKIVDEYADHMPHATRHIDAMIELIEKLIDAAHAYVADDGAVYYDVSTFEAYGALSGNITDRLVAGAGGRIQEAHQIGKRNPADFLLWKPDETHIMKWDSPWGVGYPGWHIECSAMALAAHGVETLDIHTGGEDNIFPHHECEIAQSTGATGKPFARFWMHVRHLMVEGEKMSKSKGNFFTLRDLIARGADPAAVRYALMGSHYRANANFTMKGLADAHRAVQRLRDVAATHPDVQAEAPRMGDSDVERKVAEALADDLNISGALGAVHAWLNTLSSVNREDVAILRRIDQVLDVVRERDIELPEPTGLSDEQIERKIERINEARAAKDYATSDAVRAELEEAGVEVQITREGATWRRKAGAALES